MRRHSATTRSGFTLIELIAVILIIAVLSAIIAPGWLAFVNRQRVAKVNDAIFSAMQEAQREAKRTNLSYNVSFQDSSQLEVAVYPEGTASADIPWRPLSEGLDLEPDQVLLCSNVGTNVNTTGSVDCDLSTAKTIAFDYLGNLADKPNGDSPDTPLIVTAGIPQSNNSNAVIDATKRCVQVKTLIGSMQLGQGKYDETSNPQGCP